MSLLQRQGGTKTMAGDNKSALIAMSGGVDSSVAAYLMKNQGYRCMGITMRLYRNNGRRSIHEEQSLKREDMEKRRMI